MRMIIKCVGKSKPLSNTGCRETDTWSGGSNIALTLRCNKIDVLSVIDSLFGSLRMDGMVVDEWESLCCAVHHDLVFGVTVVDFQHCNLSVLESWIC